MHPTRHLSTALPTWSGRCGRCASPPEPTSPSPQRGHVRPRFVADATRAAGRFGAASPVPPRRLRSGARARVTTCALSRHCLGSKKPWIRDRPGCRRLDRRDIEIRSLAVALAVGRKAVVPSTACALQATPSRAPPRRTPRAQGQRRQTPPVPSSCPAWRGGAALALCLAKLQSEIAIEVRRSARTRT